MSSDRRLSVTEGDLTSPDALRAALHESERFYATLVESLPQFILRKDLEGRFTFGNERFCRSVGTTFDGLIGRTDFDFFPPELAEQYQADDRRVIASGELYEAVERHETPGGRRYVHIIKTPVKNASGRICGIQCIFWDVTEHRQLEEQLRQERELLRCLLDTLPDSIYFKDAQSRFVRISRSQAIRFGLSDPAEAEGKTDADFFSESHANETLTDEQEVMQTGVPIVGKSEHETFRDGRERWVLTTKMPWRDADGRITGTLGISSDVTELTDAKNQLAIARDAALESARLKSEFLANMSHEIRTPLNAVVGMAGLLIDTTLTADQREFAQTIRTSADVLLGIVNDILDFSKIEAGKMTIEEVTFDVVQVLEEAADLVAESAQQKGIELAMSVPALLPRLASGDPGRIRQVLVNLLSNAVKFTPRGDVVVALDVVGEQGGKRRYRWQVRDTGIGIVKEAQSRLFSAFTQADGSTTRRHGGTGLGLAICKRLVELMGGSIGFESTSGQGSTFWFTLDLEPKSGAPLPVEQGSLEHVHTLIVDDSATNRTILRRQVAAWAMRDACVSSGPEALNCLRQAAANGDPFQLVILDLQMPDMDGLAVARAMRADPQLRDVAIVILTSLAFHPDEVDRHALGIAAYLTKPVKPSRLYDTLAGVMGRRTLTDLDRLVTKERMQAVRLAARPDGRSFRALVAEDNPINQKVALRLLERLGVVADAVATGVEALDALQRTPYDVVLMDCQMPEMDGYEATGRIRQREVAGKTARRQYIIALTAHALEGDRERCLRAGMDDYLSKPLRIENLSAALQRCVETDAMATR